MYKTIQDFSRQYHIILNYIHAKTRLYGTIHWTILDHTGLYWMIFDYTRPYLTIVGNTMQTFNRFNKSMTDSQTDSQTDRQTE